MRLKKLDIYGFKSFAEHTHMEFGNGITGVVGPNGSGKSNISDAVRWVLGEQSARTLRGAKMEDVIFNGTEKRKPLSYCEVSLTLDNADGALPVQFAEVRITRRVYRSGESEYFINRSACRLRDIIEIFRDTGIGKEGYSLIGQGRIDEILSARSEDRRAVFEEAAGISKYKARKADAERKIDNTNQNLTRVEDIISEARRQIEPLSKQAEKAERYAALFDELRELDMTQFVLRYDAIKQRAGEHEQAAAVQKQAMANAQTEYERAKAEREKLNLLQSASESRTQELRTAVVELTRTVQEKQGELDVIAERVQALGRERSRLNADTAGASEALDEMAKRRERLSAAQSSQAGERTRMQAELANKEAELARRSGELDREAQTIEERKAGLMEAINRLSDVKSAKARLTAMRQAITERAEACRTEGDSLHKQLDALEELRGAGQSEQAEAQKRCAKAHAAVDAAEQKLSQNRETRTKVQQAVQKLTLSRQQTETRLKVMREMARDYEGYQLSVKQVMRKAESEGDRGVVGVVAGILKVPRELEKAADMVLGSALQNVIVETEQDAKRMIEYLRANKYGRATFLPVSSVNGRTLSAAERQALNTEGCLGVLSELVQFDRRYQGIVDNLMGRTVVARDLDAGIEIMRRSRHQFRLVTLEGDVMHSGGSMTGGSIQSRVTNLLSRDREILEHENALSALDKKLGEGGTRLTQLERERAELHTKLDADANELRVCEDDMLRMEQQLSQLAKERADLDARIQRVELEKGNLAINLEDVMRELGGITGEQGAAESDHEQMQRDIAAQQRALLEKRRALDGMQEELTRRRIELAEHVRDENARRAEMERLEAEMRSRGNMLEDIKAKLQGDAEAMEALSDEREKGVEARDRANASLARVRTELDAADADSAARARQRERLDDELEARQSDIAGLTEQMHRMEMLIDRAKVELDNLQQRIWKDYELTYEACAERAKRNIMLNDADKRIAVLRGKLRALGNVNVNAAQEFKEAKARLDEMTAQRDDLIHARKDLERIIEDLTGQMKAQFTEKFKLLNERFQIAFRALFGGGSARLILQNENDVLNCGIDIIAQPPGKKQQMLSLLSGGERALTAIATLFSMLDIRPTPFCILDEIEAALDDANIENFAQYLNRYSEKTQFIVITHRKGTMECCDTLYGIAMEEKGVSRMVSVALSDVQDSV